MSEETMIFAVVLFGTHPPPPLFSSELALTGSTCYADRRKTRREARRVLHCKERLAIFPSSAGMSLTKLTEQFNYSQESWVSDIPTGDGKIAKLFLKKGVGVSDRVLELNKT